MLRISPIYRLLASFAVFLLPVITMAFEGEAKITGCYLDKPAKNNQKDAYANLVRKIRERVKFSCQGCYPDPSNPGKNYLVDTNIYISTISFCYAVEAHNFRKLEQLKGVQSKWTKIKLKRKNLYSDLFYFSAQVCCQNNQLVKITGLLKVVPVIPVPISDIKKGEEIKLNNLVDQSVSWEFLRSSINSFEGLALTSSSLEGNAAEIELLAGQPIYLQKLRNTALRNATLFRILYGY